MITNQQLGERACEFAESYFRYMRITSDIHEPSIIHDFLVFELDGMELLAVTETGAEMDINAFTFAVGDPGEGFSGECNTANMTITIAPESAEDDNVLLHEMIHAFEHLIDRLRSYSQLHDVVLLCLYNDLKPKIPDLDGRIIHHAHLETGVGITEDGGRHDVLFLLKSFDLDLRLGRPLGTVCGYERDSFTPLIEENLRIGLEDWPEAPSEE